MCKLHFHRHSLNNSCLNLWLRNAWWLTSLRQTTMYSSEISYKTHLFHQNVWNLSLCTKENWTVSVWHRCIFELLLTSYLFQICIGCSYHTKFLLLWNDLSCPVTWCTHSNMLMTLNFLGQEKSFLTLYSQYKHQ